jgi:hypothetical protein
MKNQSVFTGNGHIWGWVYGVPSVLGTVLLMFGGETARGFGGLCLVGVAGSFILISAIEAFHNWLLRR